MSTVRQPRGRNTQKTRIIDIRRRCELAGLGIARASLMWGEAGRFSKQHVLPIAQLRSTRHDQRCGHTEAIMFKRTLPIHHKFASLKSRLILTETIGQKMADMLPILRRYWADTWTLLGLYLATNWALLGRYLAAKWPVLGQFATLCLHFGQSKPLIHPSFGRLGHQVVSNLPVSGFRQGPPRPIQRRPGIVAYAAGFDEVGRSQLEKSQFGGSKPARDLQHRFLHRKWSP